MSLLCLTRAVLPLCLLVLVSSCASNGEAASDTNQPLDGAQGDQSLPDTQQPPEDSGPEVVLEDWALDWNSGFIYARAYRTVKCTDKYFCPLLVVVPDLNPKGILFTDEDLSNLAREAGAVVVTYNPPGTGEGERISGGTVDFGGQADQDALKDVITFAHKQDYVLRSVVGVVTLGDSLVVGAGAAARFKETNLPFLDYLIDVEGPTNRCFATLSPYTGGQRPVKSDGAGISTARCDFNLYDRLTKFPEGSSTDGKGTDGTPDCFLCNSNAWPLFEAAQTCDDDGWWTDREAKGFLERLPIHYLRIQFLNDHRQPTRLAAREAFRWLAAGGKSLSYQLNNLQANKPITSLTEEQLLTAGVYLDLPGLGNGLGEGTFAQTGFSQVSPAEFFRYVLPKYVTRMQERVVEQ
jgi:hypothetical protein